MILQLTSAGRALLNSNPAGVAITRADFGTVFNATLPEEPTGHLGFLNYSSNVVWAPQIVDPNTLRYSLYLAASLATFTFGNVALYSGSTLVGVGINPTAIIKQGPASGSEGSSLKLDIFLATEGSQKYAIAEVQTPGQISSFPRVNTPDSLVPPAINQMNAYIVYGTQEDSLAYLAFADPTGKWTFTAKPQVQYVGTINSCSDTSLTCSLEGSYSGPSSDLVLQFVSGTKRGYCRTVESISTEDGYVTWAIDLPEGQRPAPGDSFIILGPQMYSGGGGGGDGPGDKGPTGDKGPRGDKGLTGDKGPDGNLGNKGSIGNKGPDGDQGDKGLPGDKGATGDKGLRGDQGDKGLEGDKGVIGDKGPDGDGAPGDKGPTGDKGVEGDKGPVGDKGPTGDAGPGGGGGSGGGFTNGESAPGAPELGHRWYKPSVGKLFTYINDGLADTWVEL